MDRAAPGPPRELKPMFQEQILPGWSARVRRSNVSRELRVAAWANRRSNKRIQANLHALRRRDHHHSRRAGEFRFICRIWTDDAATRKKRSMKFRRVLSWR